MDPLDLIHVMFHYNGEFVKNGNHMMYLGGSEAMSDIDRDKLSLPELLGHLRDHCTDVEGIQCSFIG